MLKSGNPAFAYTFAIILNAAAHSGGLSQIWRIKRSYEKATLGKTLRQDFESLYPTL